MSKLRSIFFNLCGDNFLILVSLPVLLYSLTNGRPLASSTSLLNVFLVIPLVVSLSFNVINLSASRFTASIRFSCISPFKDVNVLGLSFDLISSNNFCVSLLTF